jgi:uncharacterized protein YegL
VTVAMILLLDLSASMTGAPIEALKQGVTLLHNTLATRSNRPASLAVLSYHSQAVWLIQPQDAKQALVLPELETGGTSGLGAALRLIIEKLGKDDLPLIYLFTDGDAPTDEWEAALDALKERAARVIGLACGLNPRLEWLRQACQDVYLLRELTPDSLLNTFRTLGL